MARTRPSPSSATRAACCTPLPASRSRMRRTDRSAAVCSVRSSVVSTTMSSVGSPTRLRIDLSSQSMKYWACWVASVRETMTGWVTACSRWAAVMTPASSISFSTTVARAAARSLSDTGE